MANLRTGTSSYPNSIDTQTPISNLTDTVVAEDVNGLLAAVEKIENELNIGLKGSQATLTDRLARILAVEGGIRRGTTDPVAPPPVSGDLFYRTDLSALRVFDSTTSAWSSVGAGGIADGSITAAMLAAGIISDLHVSATAAIATTKLATGPIASGITVPAAQITNQVANSQVAQLPPVGTAPSPASCPATTITGQLPPVGTAPSPANCPATTITGQLPPVGTAPSPLSCPGPAITGTMAVTNLAQLPPVGTAPSPLSCPGTAITGTIAVANLAQLPALGTAPSPPLPVQGSREKFTNPGAVTTSGNGVFDMIFTANVPPSALNRNYILFASMRGTRVGSIMPVTITFRVTVTGANVAVEYPTPFSNIFTTTGTIPGAPGTGDLFVSIIAGFISPNATLSFVAEIMQPNLDGNVTVNPNECVALFFLNSF